MELWIRSQDRQDLIKVGELFATTNLLNNDDWEIVTIANENNTCHLGKYKTKERALEILDEIQKILQPKLINYISPTDELVELVGGRGFGKTMKMEQDIEIKELSTCVYEMPKE